MTRAEPTTRSPRAWLDARRAGATKYTSAKPCRCGCAVRYTSSRLCILCAAALRSEARHAARKGEEE